METIKLHFEELITTIHEYESDTFSASANKLTKNEAELIAIEFVIRDIARRINTETMDGVMISEELENLRGEEE